MQPKVTFEDILSSPERYIRLRGDRVAEMAEPAKLLVAVRPGDSTPEDLVKWYQTHQKSIPFYVTRPVDPNYVKIQKDVMNGLKRRHRLARYFVIVPEEPVQLELF